MTCFIPTLVLCRKTRGKSSHNSSICLKRMEKVLLEQDHVRVVCCCVRWEWKCAEKQATLSLHKPQIGAQVLVKYS